MQKTNSSRTHVDWHALREEYENTQQSAASLARKYETSTTNVSYHARTKGWKRPDDYEKPVAYLRPAEAKLKPLIAPLESQDAYLPVVGATHLTSVPVSDDIEALAKLRDRIIGQHKVSISRDMAYLDVLEKGIMEKKSAPLQKLNALATIVKIRGQLVDLERQAHSIAGESGRPPVAIQVNVNVSPQDAYLQMIGKA